MSEVPLQGCSDGVDNRFGVVVKEGLGEDLEGGATQGLIGDSQQGFLVPDPNSSPLSLNRKR